MIREAIMSKSFQEFTDTNIFVTVFSLNRITKKIPEIS